MTIFLADIKVRTRWATATFESLERALDWARRLNTDSLGPVERVLITQMEVMEK